MAASRTLKFLPNIFQTDANKKFISATVDQLISEPNFKKVNGYIGRKLSPTYKSTDSYVTEPTSVRQNYQLEPAVILKDENKKITGINTYPDLLQQIEYYGGLTNNHNRLFENEFYTFDPLIDLDKFVNFSQYYWLPNGPAAVKVFAGAVDQNAEYEVIKDNTLNCYKFSSFGQTPNPIITLARGGSYKFKLNQNTKFWIQTEPGLSGFKSVEANISTRDILGVENNGAENGEIIFNVPLATAQDFYVTMPLSASVNYAVTLSYKELQNRLLSDFIASGKTLDGSTSNLNGKTLVFINNDTSDDSWTSQWAPVGTVPENLRFGVWRIDLVEVPSDYVIQLTWIQDVPINHKVYITTGLTESGKEFRKLPAGFFEEIPPITATLDTLYYQDGTNPSQVGVIKIVETFGNRIDVDNEILGKTNYRSPNGVEFTNGLKVQFDSTALQEKYIGKSFYVEGVGKGIRLVPESSLVTPEFRNNGISIPYDIYSYDTDKFDENLSGPQDKDYITINRASIDLNPWSRSNRWFHVDVINKTAEYNKTPAIIDQTQRATRPIIEFEPNLKLFNNGDIGKQAVDILDFSVTRPFNNIDFIIPEEKIISVNSSIINTSEFNGVEQTVNIFVPSLTGNIDSATETIDIPGAEITIDGRKTIVSSRNNIPVTIYSVVAPGLSNTVHPLTNSFTVPGFIQTITVDGEVIDIEFLDREVVVTGPLTTIPSIESEEFVFKGNTYKVSLPATVATVSSGIATWGNRKINAFYEVVIPALPVRTESIQGNPNFFQFGLTLQVGMRLVFANCYDPMIRNKIYEVQKITIAGIDQIYLVQTDDAEILPGDTLVTLTGIENQGVSYWFDGNLWHEAQQKTQVNQPPLFDLYDLNNNSFSSVVYPSSTFKGSKIFSYKVGTGKPDSVLGFPLVYKNFGSVADITFVNNIYHDVFKYLVGNELVDNSTKNGNVYKIKNRNEYSARNLWNKNKDNSKQYQIFSLVFTGRTNHVEIDVLPDEEIEIPNIFVYLNNKKLNRNQYSIVPVGARQTVLVNLDLLQVGDKIDVLIYNKKQSTQLGYYEIPKNLNLNPLNQDFSELTLGQMRNHFSTIASNSIAIQGQIPGNSNYRDLYLNNYPGSILQHSAPSIYAHLFLTDKQVNFIDSIEYAQKEYSRFKYKFLDLISTLPNIPTKNPAQAVDQVLEIIGAVKNKDFPWYYSDMVPYGGNKNTVTYSVLDPDIRQYELTRVFNDTELSNRAVLVYLNGLQLIKGKDYFIFKDRPAIYIKNSVELNYNDTIDIFEYSNTDANFIPETPTKLGLYPKFTPEIKLDDTYQTPINVIQGHDGSIMPAFNDFRDDIVLELEKRIYNNIKIDETKYPTHKIWDFIPGKFRDTDYTREEFNRVLGKNFLRWVGNNKIDYTSNDKYSSSNKWTWNYGRFLDSVTKTENLPGYWRGIYKYFFDTDRPHTHAWEMFGFSEKPDWWDDRYGPAPYTGANITLWTDVEQGFIAQGPRAGIDKRFARPGVLKHIPVDQHGQLLPPIYFAVAAFNSNKTDAPFAIGDHGPVETAWIRSSEYPFAILSALALTKPAFFFGTLMDITSYWFNSNLNQYSVNNENERIKPELIKINGRLKNQTEVERAAGYINWISEYLTSLGIVGPQRVLDTLRNISVQLTYKAAGYTDKKYLRVLAEQNSPNSINDSVILPEENYNVVLHKSAPINRAVYSAVIVQKTQAGYSVQGYNLNNPYFTIIPSLPTNNFYVVEANGARGVIYQDYERIKVTVPYGYQFTKIQEVVDFLVGHQRYLVSQGFIFDNFNGDFGQIEDWALSAQEFLHWSQQGWGPGNLIVLSPVFNAVKFAVPQGTVDEITGSARKSKILDTNFNVLSKNNLNFIRDDDLFEVSTLQGQTIALVDLNVVEYEHALVFDNETIFKDVIYKPELGERQYRLKIIGNKTANWRGRLDPAGFIYNQENFEEWQAGKDYKKGDIVIHKTLYYTALKNIPAATTFDLSNWTQIDKNSIKTGLLPNFANNAKKSEDYYDVDAQSQDPNFDKFAYGLIGFRNRAYFNDLGLDTTSQVKFYQGFIREKGTANAVTALTNASFNNVAGDIKYYEEWAFRVGEYGAISNNQFFELELKEEKFLSNPGIVQLLDSGNLVSSDKIAGYRKEDLYIKPESYRSKFLLPRDKNTVIEKDIETAGFVHLNDIDATLFDINDYKNLNAKINNIGPGYKIWVAKSYGDTWDVFRVTTAPTKIAGLKYAAPNFMDIEFTRAHNMQPGKILVIKNFDDLFDGFYQVHSIVNNKTLRVYGYQNLETLIELEDGQLFTSNTIGLVFELMSVKFSSPTQINQKIPATGWRDGDKFWVASDDQGNWAVYEKRSSWQHLYELPLTTNEFVSNSGYGYSVALNIDANSAFASAINVENNIQKIDPDLNPPPIYVYGEIKYFIRNGESFEQRANIKPTVANTRDFGFSMVANGDLLIVGAPGSNNDRGRVFVYKLFSDGQVANIQILEPNWPVGPVPIEPARFGHAVALSDDRNWLYISAPGWDAVYPYQLKNIDESFELLIGNGSQTVFTLTEFTPYDQDMIVVYNAEKYLIPGQDFTVTGSTITFTQPLEVDQYYVKYSSSYVQVKDGANKFIIVNDVLGTSFGYSLATTANGNQVIIGAPKTTIDGKLAAGQVKIYDRNIQDFNLIVGVDTYNTRYDINVNESKVLLNGTVLRNTVDYIIIGSNQIKLLTSFSPKDTLTIETNKFILSSILESNVKTFNGNFGYSVDICPNNCSIYVGEPGKLKRNVIGGAVHRYVNQGRVYGIIVGEIVNPTVNVGDSIFINNIEVTFTGTTLSEIIDDINAANILGISAKNNANKLEINSDILLAFNKIYISPGQGTALADLGLTVFPFIQLIEQPDFGRITRFGVNVKVGAQGDQLLISSAGETSFKFTTFDNNNTIIDQNATGFVEPIINSGAVFMYEYLVDKDPSLSNPGQFVYAQQLSSPDVDSNDGFGHSIDYSKNYILISSINDSFVIENDPFTVNDNNEILSTGNVYLFTNNGNKVIKKIRQEEEKVDIESLTRLFIYDKKSKIISTNLDFIDPAKGRILGQAEQYLNFKSSQDPAVYNVGNTNELNFDIEYHWGRSQVGMTWWDLSTVRYIDYEQDSLEYRTSNWGRTFPGSKITVYEWIESDYPPSQHRGEGTPKYANNSAFVTSSYIDAITGVVTNKYYYWISGKESVDPTQSRNVSIVELEKLIADPKLQNIPYAAPIRTDALALFNVNSYISDSNTILHVDYEYVKDKNLIHSEYELVQENNELSGIPNRILSKLVDSLVGADAKYNLVPNYTLKPSERYGLGVRPMQTILVNRTEGVKNFVGFVNNILKQNPLFGQFNLSKFFLKDPLPQNVDYDEKVANLEELAFRLTEPVAVNTRILVIDDEEFNNRWTVRQVKQVSPEVVTLAIRMQSYDTANYWDYADWYAAGYDPTKRPTYTVETFTDVARLKLRVGDIVKVRNNGAGNFEILEYDGNRLILVGIQNGTIQLSEKLYTLTGAGFDTDIFDAVDYDSIPFTEFRNIIEGILRDVFVNNLKPELSRLFFTMMNYILSEQVSLDWAFKTSFISIVHKLRKLDQFPNFVRDNQNYYLDYINEVKPYRTKIREYLIDYEGFDEYKAEVTDFDLPGYYDERARSYRSPDGSKVYDKDTLKTYPYYHWNNNHTLSLERLDIINGGTGYSSPPQISIIGGGGVGATAVANIDLYFGRIISVTVTDPGYGYTSIPQVIINGDGNGAILYPVMRGSKARSIETKLTFDRTTYLTQWQAGKVYHKGAIVFHEGQIYIARGNTYSTLEDYRASLETFEINDFETMEYHRAQDLLENTATGKFLMWNWKKPHDARLDAAAANQVIERLFAGVKYPGVKVDGNTFPANGIFELGYDPEVDTILTRQFTDATAEEEQNDIDIDGNVLSGSSNVVFDGGNLDTNPTSIIDQGSVLSSLNNIPGDVITEGGKFIDRYHSHAPEELVPGRMFDNLVISVFTLNQADITQCIGYRIEHDMQGRRTYRRIAESASTQLSQPLNITDTEIIVQEINKLPAPGTNIGQPGIVYINGEKIYYWGIDVARRALTNIRRAVDGTGAPLLHPAGSRVDDASLLQLVPGVFERGEVEGELFDPDNPELGFTVPSLGQHWYNVGAFTATDGNGLWASMTIQAQFLREKLSYLPSSQSPLADLLLLTEDLYGFDSLPYDAKLF